MRVREGKGERREGEATQKETTLTHRLREGKGKERYTEGGRTDNTRTYKDNR